MESCHPVEIELGLQRSQKVLERLLIKKLTLPIITVAGTNGKGSTVAVLEALAIQANKKVLTFTSPHFINYRERLRLNGQWLSEDSHIKAFEAVEFARNNEQLTYFEFSTLAAFKCVELIQPDLLILETGLGGRLDAVNLLEADIAIITTVDYDHQDWLGTDLESIAREKAGIIHTDKKAIIADPNFPKIIIDEILSRTDSISIADKEFKHIDHQNGWSWQNQQYGPWHFDYPTFPFANASAAIQAWCMLYDFEKLSESFIRSALSNIKLSGRFETVAEKPEVILDVAHNPQAFKNLLRLLSKHKIKGETHLVLGMLEDKNAKNCLKLLKSEIDQWFLSDIQGSRGQTANSLKKILSDSEIGLNKLQCYSSPVEAFKVAYDNASKDDRILVTGSFYTVAPVLELFQKSDLENTKSGLERSM